MDSAASPVTHKAAGGAIAGEGRQAGQGGDWRRKA